MANWPSTADALVTPTSTTPTNSTTARHSNQHGLLSAVALGVAGKLGYSSSTSGAGIITASTSLGDMLYVSDTLGRTRWGPRAPICLADVLATATAASITFSNIPQTYRHLQLIGNLRTQSTSAQVTRARFNGNTSTSYAVQTLTAIDTALTGGRSTSDTSAAICAASPATAPAGSFSSIRMTIYDYTSTSAWKNYFSQTSLESSTVATPKPSLQNRAGVWASTAALTSLEILHDAGDISVGTRLSLYGSPTT